MKRFCKTITIQLLALLVTIFPLSNVGFAQTNGDAAAPQPPMTEKKTKTTTIHGDTLTDDYFWLREKTSPEVIAHLEAENTYAAEMMRPTTALQEKLYNEMVGHIKETDDTVPYRQGDYFYYTHTEKGKQYPINYRKKGSLSAKDELVFDQNELAKGLKFFSIGAFVPSDDGNLLAYSTDTTGYRQYKLQVKDMRTGQLLPESFERVGNVAWATDNKTIFFTTEDAVTKRSDKFFRHVLGSDKTDLILEEKDELFDLGASRTRDKAMILIGSFSKTSTEFRYLPADQPMAETKLIRAREAEHEYDVDHYGNSFYIRTNKGAKNFRVVSAPVSDPSEKNWKEFVPHQPAVKVDDITFFVSHAVVSEKEGGLQRLRIIDMKTKKSHRIQFPEPVYAASITVNREFN